MKPCPFCKSIDLEISEFQEMEVGPAYFTWYAVSCKECGAKGPVFHDLNSKKAEEAWDNRKNESG
jgi:Lar family restriction alleviation protein